METRLAAVSALNHIAEAVPLWSPEPPSSSQVSTQPLVPSTGRQSIEALDIETLIRSSNKVGDAAEPVKRQNGGKAKADTNRTSAESRYLHELGIDSKLISKSDSLSDVDVDDELGEDIRMPTLLTGTRRSKTSTRPAGKSETARSPMKSDPEEGPSRKKIKLECTSMASQEQETGDIDMDFPGCSRQARRSGRPKGGKSEAQSLSLPSSPSKKAPTNTPKQDDMFQGLSGRQVMVLKRKLRMNTITLEQAAEEAMKYGSYSPWPAMLG